MKSDHHIKTPLRVVIIDDDPRFGSLALRVLASTNLGARFHRGPFGSLQALREADCDVVILDISMPKLDGSLLSRLIRETFNGRIRVLLCSNMEADSLERLARVLKVDGSLPKLLFDEGRAAEIAALIRSCHEVVKSKQPLASAK